MNISYKLCVLIVHEKNIKIVIEYAYSYKTQIGDIGC